MSTESVLADGVREALAVDPEEFDARAEEEAEIVKQGLRDGAFETTSRSWASSTSSTRSPTGGGARSHERASTP